MNISKLITTSVLTLSLFLTGCGKTEKVNKVDEKKDNETLTVFTTIYPLEDFTKKIGSSTTLYFKGGTYDSDYSRLYDRYNRYYHNSASSFPVFIQF